MDPSRIAYIVDRYLSRQLTEAERQELDRMLCDPARTEALLAAFDEHAGALDMTIAADGALLPILQAALASDKPPMRVASRRWRWVAAASVLALAIAGYLWALKKDAQETTLASAPTEDVAPGRQGAILTLADGSQVVLDSLRNGAVAQQGAVRVTLSGAQLQYASSAESPDTMAYHVITTPKGRQFRVALSDGTEVWLNAASYLRYPATFGKGERVVTVKGEAYFDVAHDARRPFRVNINEKAEVAVLGTQFNVSAYENEHTIAATLLEGAVRISARSGGKAVVIRPGQQARLQPASPRHAISVSDHADIDQAIAWKNGLFSFEGHSFADIMRQLERWYDIEVVYENGVPDVQFEGQMTRDVPLSGLLTFLGRSGIHFRIAGRKLIVQP